MKNILAVAVFYKTRLEDSNTIITLNAALEYADALLDIVIYDNSPVAVYDKDKFVYGRLNIIYINDCRNSGVSKAYNLAADLGKGLNKQWLLLLDQDTSFSKDVLKKYLNAVIANPHIKLFAPVLMISNSNIFSPCRYVFKRGFPLKKVKYGVNSLRNISPVNSGMFVELDSFFRAGMYNEKVKLDFSDFQFIERFKKTNSSFYIIDSEAYQDFSNNETDIFKLNTRFGFFCEGARYCEKRYFVDYIMYFIVCFMRASSLSYRNRRLLFYKTFFLKYLLGK